MLFPFSQKSLQISEITYRYKPPFRQALLSIFKMEARNNSLLLSFFLKARVELGVIEYEAVPEHTDAACNALLLVRQSIFSLALLFSKPQKVSNTAKQ